MKQTIENIERTIELLQYQVKNNGCAEMLIGGLINDINKLIEAHVNTDYTKRLLSEDEGIE